ncbi:hypothetical protein A6F68_00517 [Tsuneonella dongtanensis]|uniref:Uncharacterized protein n=1 Tax=Tsuneonella dongtanensis TaxID=692370 RepID=A0A1B2AA94_9SPHN|nr:hypothetical protein [Tsuneonella dongtanensis]ANY19052.1 hypothetical protein A6F68_00517 [Tsuneonella dongtanensis]
MEHLQPPGPTAAAERCPYEWLARVLTNFAVAEQALGKLCAGLDLPIASGPLSSLNEARRKLVAAGEKRFTLLDNRITRWSSYRAMRHLLAHATLVELIDGAGRPMLITRTLPRDRDDVTPDRLWTLDEREELLRQATNDGRSIADQVRNILADPSSVVRLRSL